MFPQLELFHLVSFAGLLIAILFGAAARGRLRRRPQHRFPLRTHTLTYAYSATATVRSTQPTHLVFPAPPLPHRDGMRPTIVRDFTDELSVWGYRFVVTVIMRSASTDARDGG